MPCREKVVDYDPEGSAEKQSVQMVCFRETKRDGLIARYCIAVKFFSQRYRFHSN